MHLHLVLFSNLFAELTAVYLIETERCIYVSVIIGSDNGLLAGWLVPSHYLNQLEQLERLRSEDTPRRLMITHTIESCWVPNQNKVEWSWRYRSRSKVITCHTPSHASDHLCQIWKESIRNCICYRADTIFKAKAKWPWRYRSRSKVIICNTPLTLVIICAKYGKNPSRTADYFFQGKGRKISKICQEFKFSDSDKK